MKVKLINEKKIEMIGTLTYQNEELNFFENNNLVIKLKKATVEFITPFGVMINGFKKYDSKKDMYIFKRYYFNFIKEMENDFRV